MTPPSPAFNNGLGTDTDCVAAATASLLTGVDAVLPSATTSTTAAGVSAFEQSYGPTWGVKKSITYPVPGDKDWTRPPAAPTARPPRVPDTSSTSAAAAGCSAPRCHRW